MSLLFDEDYSQLSDNEIQFHEAEGNRFLIFEKVPLLQGLYTQTECDVLVEIPQNYSQDGNNMLWTYPRLVRADGNTIPTTANPGFSDNRNHQGNEYCRWSRHWNQHSKGVWKSGVDNVISIYRRVIWALENPDV